MGGEKLPSINRHALGQIDSNVQLPPISSIHNDLVKPRNVVPNSKYFDTVLSAPNTPNISPTTTSAASNALSKISDTHAASLSAQQTNTLEDEDDMEDRVLDMEVDKNCNQMRNMINKFLESGAMKVGEFQKAIGVSPASYRNFMTKNGVTGGCNSDCYYSAWRFFKVRELRGISIPKKKRKIEEDSTETETSKSKKAKTTPSASTTSTSTSTSSATPAPPPPTIILDGESTDSVPVYDTCDEIRRKISAHLRTTSSTQAQFLRDLMSQYRAETRKIQSKQLADFRAKKGPDAGNTSCIYYSAYCFFERQRLAEGKKKSVHRENMEMEWPNGMDTVRPASRTYFVPSGWAVVQDKYGKVSSRPEGGLR